MKRSADTSSMDIDLSGEDLSVLRKPIKTSMNGFSEARKAYDNGTEEVCSHFLHFWILNQIFYVNFCLFLFFFFQVKKLLSSQCDLIYECKVCRNIFRSFANFVSHKRIYCKANFNSAIHFEFNEGCFNQDISTIIQAESEYITASSKPQNGSGKNQDKDLCSIIDRLVKRERANRMMKLSDFYDQVNNKLTQDEVLQKNHVLQLDRVPESTVAVYQTFKTDDNESIRTEVNEMHEMLEHRKTVLGPDGKLLTINDLPLFADNKLTQIHQCEICK